MASRTTIVVPLTESIPMESLDWQSCGCYKLAQLMGPYQDVAHFRRFGPLTMFNLMALQAEIVDLDVQLRNAIKEDDCCVDAEAQLSSSYVYPLNHSSRTGSSRAQLKLLEQIRPKMKECCE